MRLLPLLLLVACLPACGRSPAPMQAPRPRQVAPAARAAGSLAQDALGAYAKQLDAVMKAVATNDPRRVQAAVEQLLKVLVQALRGISQALKSDGAPSDAVDAALTDADALWARYEALPGELTGEKAAVVHELEQKLVQALLSQLSARP